MPAVVDGLKGFPDTITAAFPKAVVQTYIVHLLRELDGLRIVERRKPLVTALRGIDRAVRPKPLRRY